MTIWPSEISLRDGGFMAQLKSLGYKLRKDEKQQRNKTVREQLFHMACSEKRKVDSESKAYSRRWLAGLQFT